jgi:hypothetical protein
LLHLYGDHVLPFDSPTAEAAGALTDLPAAAVTLRILPTSPLRRLLGGMA